MRQQWHRHPKTLRVGIKRNVPERYGMVFGGIDIEGMHMAKCVDAWIWEGM